MQANVVKIFKENMWDLATCANNEPNVVTVAFKDVTEDGKLIVGDVFLETTLNNLKANDGKIAITAYDAKTLEGYQIKGTAEYITEGAIVDTFKKMVETMFNGAATAKGALVITPSKIIVTQITRKNFNSRCICSNFSYTKTEAPSGYYIRRESLFYCKFYSCFSYILNRQFIRRKFSLHDSQCPTSYTCIRKTRAVPSFPARGLPQCCIRTTAAQFPNQSYPAVPVPARAESS